MLKFYYSSLLFKRIREGFLRNPKPLPRASCATQNEEAAEQLSFLYLSTFPFNKLMSMCLYTKKRALSDSFFIFVLRRERDSNPRSLSAQRFSRPPQSTTLPSLLEIGCKSTAFFSNTQIFCKNSCQYAKNIVILHPK